LPIVIDRSGERDETDLKPLAGRRFRRYRLGAGLLRRSSLRLGAAVTGNRSAPSMWILLATASARALEIDYRVGLRGGSWNGPTISSPRSRVLEHVVRDPADFVGALARRWPGAGLLLTSDSQPTTGRCLIMIGPR